MQVQPPLRSLLALGLATGLVLGSGSPSAHAQQGAVASPQVGAPSASGQMGAGGGPSASGQMGPGGSPSASGQVGAGALGAGEGAQPYAGMGMGMGAEGQPGGPGAGAGAEPLSATPATDALNAALAARGDTGVGSGASLGFPVIGDMSPVSSFQKLGNTPGIPGPFPPGGVPGRPNFRAAALLAPSVRSFKIAEDQSPRPQDRVFYAFNDFNNVNSDVNRRIGSPVEAMRVYRNAFGFEKTFNEGQGSLGMRLPIYTLTANPRPGSGISTPTSTAAGDLDLFGKYILAQDRATGSLISAGLSLSLPTGPRQFAGARYVNSLHATEFQPFLGFILNRGRFYMQGFSAIDVPTDNNLATMFYNDVAFGYLYYQDPNAYSRAIVTAIAPTFEVHVNTPLNHRDVYNVNGIGGTADNVNLTYGVNVEMMRSSVASFAFVTPVTSPKPFDYEFIFMLNIRFGASRAQRVFPIVGN